MDGPTLRSTYDYPLVALSVLIAIAASYAALTLAERVSMARNQARTAWLFGGAVAMGTGIWSMHYTGMIAYRLPVQVYCHVPTVLLSLLAAIGALLRRALRGQPTENECAARRGRQSAYGCRYLRHALHRYGRDALARHAPL